jgi:hypothetical protein
MSKATWLLSSLILLIAVNIHAQRKEDVIYHSGGAVVRGIIMQDTLPGKVRILDHAGNIWSFNHSEIDSIKREKPFEYKAMIFNQPGFEFLINAEFLIRSQDNAIGKTVIPGLDLNFGYRVNPHASIAAMIAMQFYDTMEMPLSLAVNVRPWNHALSPYILLQAGYTVAIEKMASDWDYNYASLGGLNATIGIGIERIINENAAFTLSFSYHYQELNYHLSPLHQWVQERTRTETYNRFRLAIGYVFK